jgi:protease YdgD
MKHWAILLSLGLAGQAFGQDSGGGITSGLDRLTSREDLRGFEPVGRVDVENGGFCTGTLIAGDLVLTAAHCVIEDDGTPIDAGRITFRAGLSHGKAIVEAAVVRTIVPEGYRRIEPAPLEVLQRDVALLQLGTAIETSVISPFTIGLPGEGEEVSVVSYAAGREEALSWQRVCKVLARQDALIAFDCAVTYGSSGAPVLDRSGYRARIVSIISAGSKLDGKAVAIGMELPEVVDALKAALRRGEATSEIAAPEVSEKRIGIGIGIGTGSGADRDTGAKFLKP